MKKQNQSAGKAANIITAIIFIIIAVVIFRVCSSIMNTDSESNNVVLKAQVDFTGTQFVITNNDSFDYNDVTISINGDYKLNVPKLSAYETYTVGMMQFADKKGNRFNLSQKPLSVYISSRNANGKYGYYSASWN